MDELTALTPAHGLLPVSVGALRLEEVDLGIMTSVAPFRDKQKPVSDALQSACGLAYPAPNQAVRADDTRIIWFGRDMALLCGIAPDPALASIAALTDQSDAWAGVVLQGVGSVDVLARLVPVDMRPAAMPVGATARTLLGHMSVSITADGPDRFIILVFRSMTETLVHEVREAMEAVTARKTR